MKTYKVTLVKKTGATSTKTFKFADNESGRPACQYAGKQFSTGDVEKVCVVKNPRGTSTTVLYFDLNASRDNWVFPSKQN
jgi:hypothetical protein